MDLAGSFRARLRARKIRCVTAVHFFVHDTTNMMREILTVSLGRVANAVTAHGDTVDVLVDKDDERGTRDDPQPLLWSGGVERIETGTVSPLLSDEWRQKVDFQRQLAWSMVPPKPKPESRHVNWDELEDPVVEQQRRLDQQKQRNDFWTEALQAQVDETPLVDHFSWRDYVTPPYTFVEEPKTLDDDAWIHDEFLDGAIRQRLEDFDACQGIFVHSTNCHSLTAPLLEYCHDECPASRRVVHWFQPTPAAPSLRERLFQALDSACAWHDWETHAVVPLTSPDTFVERARLAASLATAWSALDTPVALNAHYEGSWEGNFGSAPCLTLAELLQSLQPSHQYKVLEVDYWKPTHQRLAWDELYRGTSVERQELLREGKDPGRRVVDPGAWMQEAPKGILSSWSCDSKPAAGWSNQQHFGLAGSLRAPLQESGWSHPMNPSLRSMTVQCLMEGMGIPCRPEQSVVAIRDEAMFRDLYWSHVWPSSSSLSVLRNSTRSFASLEQLSRQAQQALLPKYGVRLEREYDDCLEAVSTVLSLRDVYRPGMSDDEGYGEDF